MPYSITEAQGTGSSINVAVPPYLSKSHITVYVDGLPTTAFEWVNDSTIGIIAPANRLVRVVRRTSPGALLTQYMDGTSLPGDTLELDSKQAFYMAQEALDVAHLSGGSAGGTPLPGVELTTEGIIALLNGQLQLSEMAQGLRDVIGLIDGPEAVPNTVAWRVRQEALSRAAALQAEAESRTAALLTEALDRQAAITAESEIRQEAELSLSNRIDTATAAIGTNAAAILTEQTARVDEDGALGQRIDAVVATAAGNTAAIQAEQTARANADNAIASSVENIRVDLEAEDAALDARITSTEQAFADADEAIASTITALDAAYKAADTSLQASINSVATAYAAADTALAARLDTLRASVNPGFISDDPDLKAPTEYWLTLSGTPTYSIQAGSIAGRSAFRRAYVGGSTNGWWVSTRNWYVLDPTRQYRVAGRVRASSDSPAARTARVAVVLRDATGAIIAGAGAYWLYPWIGTPTTSWVEYGGVFGAGTANTFPGNAVYMQPAFLLYYDPANPSSAGYHEGECLRIEDVELARLGTRVGVVEVSAASNASAIDGVEANYTIKVAARSDGKNAIAGIGLNATSNGTTTQSELVLLADKIVAVPSMSDLNTTPQPLFVSGLVNGVNTFVVPASRMGDKLLEARMIVDGGIEARHMKITGGGSQLNMDPWVMDSSAWTSLAGTVNFVTGVQDIPGGATTALHNTAGAAVRAVNADHIPVDATKTYRLDAMLKLAQGTLSAGCYLLVAWYDANKTFLQTNVAQPTGAGSPVGWAGSGTYSYWALNNGAPGTTWTRYTAAFGATEAAKIPTNAKYLRVGAILNNSSVANVVVQMTGVKITEMIDSALVVQGGITADRIDSRGLTIKDAAGNVILAAGTPLASANITPASNWLNANITIGPDGALTGAGGGQVTIGGLGFMGDLSASKTLYGTSAPWTNSYTTPAAPAVSSVTVTTPAGVTDPDGGQARFYVPTTATAVHALTGLTYTGLAGQMAAGPLLVQRDIYVKAGAQAHKFQLGIRAYNAAGTISNYVLRRFNPTDGALVSSTNSAWSNVSFTSTALGNGWWKMTLRATYTRSGDEDRLSTVDQIFSPSDVQSYAGDGTNGMYLYAPSMFIGHQVEHTIGDLWANGSTGLVQRWNGHSFANAATVGATFTAGQPGTVQGQITSGTASTYIANAAIGTAQVGVLTAGNLTITALSNTVNGGASSGGRVVLATNKVSVYDTSGVLRTVMGYLL